MAGAKYLSNPASNVRRLGHTRETADQAGTGQAISQQHEATDLVL